VQERGETAHEKRKIPQKNGKQERNERKSKINFKVKKVGKIRLTKFTIKLDAKKTHGKTGV
jgi:hypothetical protein